jgi:hypothetical protein
MEYRCLLFLAEWGTTTCIANEGFLFYFNQFFSYLKFGEFLQQKKRRLN